MSKVRKGVVILAILFAAIASVQASENVRVVSDLQDVEAGFSVSSNGTSGDQISLSIPAISLNSVTLGEHEYKTIDIPGTNLLFRAELSEEGKPDVPVLTTMLAIPDEVGIQVEATYSGYDTFEDIDLAPVQPSPSDSATNEVIPFTIDNNAYTTDAFYPGELAVAAEPIIMRDVRGVQVSLQPVQYNPVRRELRVYHDLAVNISYGGEVINPKITRTPNLSEGFYQIYKNTFSNFDEVFATAEVQRGGYMIICKASIADTLKALARWKHQKGYTSRIVPTTEINSNGSPTNTQIFNFIQNAYRTWQTPPEYVMIVGDIDGSLAVVDYPYSYYASDNKYACVDGTDWIPDIFVARTSVDNISQLRIALAKMLKYEKTPRMADPTHWIRGLSVGFTMYNTARYTTLWVRELALQKGFARVDTVYGSSHSPLVAQYMNTGPAYIWYRGEGGSDGWWGVDYYISDLNAMPNNQQLGVMSPLTCGLGAFNANDCFGEVWVNMGFNPDSLKGGPAFYGVSDGGTHTKWNNPIMVGYFFGIFEQDIYHFAAAAVAGKMQDYRTFPRNLSMVQQYFHTYNMQGDPELELRTKIPVLLTVTHQDTIEFGLNHIEINVVDTAGNPVNNAFVTLIKYDSTNAEELYSLGKTDEVGNLELPFYALTPGSMLLTVSGRDLYPYEGHVQIVQSEIAVGFDSLAIDDDMNGLSHGNNDRLANPGETLELTIALQNFGDSISANGITTSLTPLTDNLVDILDGDGAYEDIAPGESHMDDEPYVVRIMPDAKDGDVVQLKQTVTDQNEHTWYSVIEIPVVAPKFIVNRVTVQDENNRLDPGDTVNIVLSLINRGHAAAQAVTATISTQDDYTALLDNTVEFGDMPVADTSLSADSVVFAVDLGAYAGRQIDFTLNTSTASGLTAAVPFHVKVDSVLVATDPTGPDEYGYYMYDKTDTTYALHPTYNWVECAPGLGGQGTRLTFSGNTDDKSVLVTLPFDFVYYGEHYGVLIVSTNGFVSPDTFRYDMGGNFWANFFNWPIPDPGNARAQISPFWDDLQISTTGNYGVFTWNDTTEHRFVIAWNHATHRNTSAVETFEMIIYDPVYHPTLTGDAEIVYQYNVINNNDTDENYGTVGCEDWSQTIGSQYTHDNYYSPGAATLAANMAIKITTNTGRGGISGTVDLAGTDDNSGASVTTSNGQHRATAADGTYWIRSIQPGVVSVSAAATGYFPQKRDTLTVVADQKITGINFELQPCPVPTNLAASDGLAGGVELTWSAVTHPNLAGYYIYRSHWENGEFIRVNLNPVTETHYTDATLPDTGVYWYYVIAIYSNNQWLAESFGSVKDHGYTTSVSISEGESQIPTEFFLSQNYPNPFNPTTLISFGLPTDSDVKVEVFNLLGQRVRTLLHSQEKAGYKTIIWDGNDESGKGVASGVYFYKVEAGKYNETKKMTLLR
jgi:hypothetical protein